MAIVSVKPIHPRRRSSFRDSRYTHYLMWLVTSDNATDGTAAAVVADGLPTLGSAFVNVDGSVSYMSGIDVDPRDNSDRHFEVQVEFTTLDPSQPDDNPLNQPPGFSWSYSDTTESYFKDESPASVTNAKGENGPFIVANSAGDAFTQFLQRERGELQITMTRNEATHNAAAADAYSHTTNQSPVNLDGTTFDVGTLKISPIGATKNRKTLRNGISIVYYAKTYIFKARHQGWHDKPLDLGFSELVGEKTKNTQGFQPIVDSNGLPLKNPWPLNGKGKKKSNATDDAAVLDFQPYGPKSWSELNFA